MEWLHYKKDMFGQKLLVGVNWDQLWVPVAAAAALVVLHFIYKLVRRSA